MDHQEWIMSRVETFLEPFFQARNDAELMDARLIEWAAVLLPVSARSIDMAMLEYHKNGPRAKGSQKLLKPAVGDIYALTGRFEGASGVAAKHDRAASFADRYKRNEGIPAFCFKDAELMAEIVERNLLPREALLHHGATLPED